MRHARGGGRAGERRRRAGGKSAVSRMYACDAGVPYFDGACNRRHSGGIGPASAHKRGHAPGGGSGAVALLPLLDMALAVYDAASFDDLGMDAYEELS